MTSRPPSDDALLALRLDRQLIEWQREKGVVRLDAARVVRRLCAMQAQDYPGALWSVGLRCGVPCTLADVERALADREIVRTWPMRGTLHLVAPENVRWMLALLGGRPLARARARHAQLGVTDAVVAQARAALVEALTGGNLLTRDEAMALLAANGIDPSEQVGYHVLWTLAQQAVLCCGPMRSKQQTFVLLDEWVPRELDAPVTRATALSTLAELYFAAHGPATASDLAWWAGITKTQARAGIEGAGRALRQLPGTEYWLPAEAPVPDARSLASASATAAVHLLPGFDEYFLGYTDRRLPMGVHGDTYRGRVSANGMFSPTVIAGGCVAGTWKRALRADRVDITVTPFRPLTRAELWGLAHAAEKYGAFVGREARVAMAD